MKRRKFLQLLGLSAATVAVAPALPKSPPVTRPTTLPPLDLVFPRVTHQGMRFILDPDCPPDTVYFMNMKNLMWGNDGRLRVAPGTERQFGKLTV